MISNSFTFLGKDDRGFSLIQVMIAAGLASFVSLGIASMFKQQTDLLAFAEDKLARINLERHLEALMTEGASCKNTLDGLAINGNKKGEKISIKDSGNQELFSRSGKSVYEHLKLTNIRVVNRSVVGGNSSGIVDLVITPERSRTGVGPSSLREIRVPVQVQATGNQISNCITLADPSGEEEGGGGGGFKSIDSIESGFRLEANTNFGPAVTKESVIAVRGLCFLSYVELGGMRSYCNTEYLGAGAWKLIAYDAPDADVGGALSNYTGDQPQICEWMCTK